MKRNIKNGWIQITNKCNLRCKYCYMNANKDSQSMTFEQFKYVLDCLIDFGSKTIMISGGEPCLHEDIVQMIQYAVLQGLSVSLVTNGTVINKELLQCLSKNNVVVQISIDAMDSDNYILSRGIDRLNQTVENIILLNSNDITVTLSVTLNNATIKEVETVANFAISNQIHTVHYGFLIPSDRCKENNMTMNRLFDALVRLYEIQINDYLYIQIDFVENYVRAVVTNDHNPYYCNSMACNNIEIQPNGDIYQCGALESLKSILPTINIFNEDRGKILNRIDMEWNSIGVFDLPICNDCYIKYICKGGCRAIVYQTFGSLYEIQPLCKEFKKFISLIINDYKSGKLNSYIKYLKIVDNLNNNGYLKHF